MAACRWSFLGPLAGDICSLKGFLMSCICCCRTCQGEVCCGGEWPRVDGVCCDGEWRTEPGVCCGGQWYPAGSSGVCCEDVWRTGAGECCGGVWRTGDGECCADAWYPDSNPCPEGEVFLRWGLNGESCGCFPETIFDGRVGEEVNTASVLEDLCPACGSTLALPYSDVDGSYIGCPGRCCVDGECTQTLSAACPGEWESGCCANDCPVPCCSEDSDGIAECEGKASVTCTAPDVLGPPNCATGCLGECCIDGVSQGQTTQGDCIAAGGQWAGVGSYLCQGEEDCRQPFSESCCETKESSSAGLTFTQPRFKRTPPFNGTLRVTVTGTTDSPILVHGTPFGLVGKRCLVNHTFLICWDEFHVEPVPCGSSFSRVDLTVCWSQEVTATEFLNFSGCNGLRIALGEQPRNCVTTLEYVGGGHTSDSTLVMRNDAIISANGTGPLVLTTPFSPILESDLTLELTGASAHNNSVPTITNPPNYITNLRKTGLGRWVLSSATSTFAGGVQVQQGELVLAVNTTGDFGGSLGAEPASGPSAVVGSDTLSATAALLLQQGVTISHRIINISGTATEVAILGGVNTAGTATFGSAGSMTVDLGRDVTLQAAGGGTVRFNNAWTNGADKNVTIGTAGKTGTVRFDGASNGLTATGTLYVNFGTLSAGAGGLPGPVAIVVASIMDVVNFNSTATLTLTSTGRATISGTGLSLGDITNNNSTNTAALDFTNGGHTVDSMSGSGNTRFGGDATVKELNGGQIALPSGVTMTVEQGASSGVISGSGSLVKTTTGTLALSGTNTFSGGTTINDGAVTAGSAGAFGTGAIVVNSGGTLNKNGFTLSNTITNNGGTVND